MIIQFPHTADALLAGKQDVLRRVCSDELAEMFRPGKMHHAYDKIPRFDGAKLAHIEIVSVRKERLSRLLEDNKYGHKEIQREGGLWATPYEFVKQLSERYKTDPERMDVWRFEFKVLRRFA